LAKRQFQFPISYCRDNAKSVKQQIFNKSTQNRAKKDTKEHKIGFLKYYNGTDLNII